MSDGTLQADKTGAGDTGPDKARTDRTGTDRTAVDRTDVEGQQTRPDRTGGRADETHKERIDRELVEMLNGLRVVLPGVQVLLAFLLTVPFTERYTALDGPTKSVYFAAVITAALASILLIAPPVHHRMRFRKGSKEQLLHVANVLVLTGTIFLAISIGAVLYVITDVTYHSAVANLTAAGIGGAAVLLWFVAPRLYTNELEADT